MDKNKEPGISFDDIILEELVFSRKEAFPEKLELDMQLSSNVSFSPGEDRLIYEMSCEIKDKSDFFSIRCTMVGFFSVIEGKENMGLKEYSNMNAPAAIFPYIRETIASTTTRAGISHVVIPPTNLRLLKQNQEKLKKVNHENERQEIEEKQDTENE
jgi:preprotein translocase subunit SecB